MISNKKINFRRKVKCVNLNKVQDAKKIKIYKQEAIKQFKSDLLTNGEILKTLKFDENKKLISNRIKVLIMRIEAH